jgi:hypothetical protein
VLRSAKSVLFALGSVFFGAGCAFFTYYTIRLAYLNIAALDISGHRQSGMYIGAVAFPVASLVFGYLSFRFARAMLRGVRNDHF